MAAAGVIDVAVEISSGPQAGAKRVLRLARMTVGSGSDNDMVMIDPSVAETQVGIQFKRSMFGTLADVKSLDGPVEVGDQTIPAGQTLEAVKLPMTLKIGLNTIQIKGENHRAPRRKRNYSEWFFTFDPILTSAILALVVLMVWSVFSAYVLNRDIQHAVSVNAPVIANEHPATKQRDWPSELRREIATVGLEDTLRVTDGGAGLIKVSGLIPTGRDPALRNLQSWYDGQPSAPTVIWDIVRDTALEGMPEIAMVRFSAPPEVLLVSGATVRLGEDIVDGWSLSGLSPAGMVLSRGAEQNILAFEELLP